MTKKQRSRDKMEKQQFGVMLDFVRKYSTPRRFMDADAKIEVLPSDTRYATAPFEERIIPA